MRIELEIEKSLEKNAETYFEKAKSAKKKILGVKKTLEQARLNADKARNSEKKIEEEKLAKDRELSRKREWFEKFHWFVSSDGFLVIGGKDATSNEVVVKKHLESTEYVYHTEAPGSPFVVIKNPDSAEIPESTRMEAAEFTASFSRAWQSGVGSLEVMEIFGNQVSKQAASGEYVGKGAFVIHGKRNIYKPSLKLAIGVFDNDGFAMVMSGPVSAVSKKCSSFEVLKQGGMKKGEIASLLMKRFNLKTNTDLLSALPAGSFVIEKKTQGGWK